MSDPNNPDFWQSIYSRGAPWDLGQATPVFRRLAESGRFSPGPLIVLGAGRGWDARLFASHGFQVTAVDFAAQAVEEMHRLADPGAPVEILQADIFDLPDELDGSFEYVLEYTCFCAIDPSRRPAYADLVARLLRPAGTYIALVFPIEDRPGGPPFGVDPDELIRLLEGRGFDLLQRERPADTIKPRRGREELVILKKRP